MVPARVDEVLPVDLVEGVFFDYGKLLGKDFGVE